MGRTGARTMQTSQPYSVHPGVAMVQKWVAELKEKTGRSLDESLALNQEEDGPKMKKRGATG